MTELSKNLAKQITGLQLKKNRDEAGLFVAEGTKVVLDLMPFFKCKDLIATTSWLDEHKDVKADTIYFTIDNDLKKISNLKTSQGVLAVFRKPDYSFTLKDIGSKLSLALDDVQDPGNLGTIIRIADWFGIENVFCSLHCADAFHPKTVQATMGALSRVKVHVVVIEDFISDCSDQLPVYGTFMDGENIYNSNLTENGIIIMGNEGNGISDKIKKLVTNRLLIPNFPIGAVTSESLNVGVATALVCAEFRRRI